MAKAKKIKLFGSVLGVGAAFAGIAAILSSCADNTPNYDGSAAAQGGTITSVKDTNNQPMTQEQSDRQTTRSQEYHTLFQQILADGGKNNFFSQIGAIGEKYYDNDKLPTSDEINACNDVQDKLLQKGENSLTDED